MACIMCFECGGLADRDNTLPSFLHPVCVLSFKDSRSFSNPVPPIPRFTASMNIMAWVTYGSACCWPLGKLGRGGREPASVHCCVWRH